MACIKQKCDFCDSPAVYDTKTGFGPWAFVCQIHFDAYSTKQKGYYKLLNEASEQTKKCISCGRVKPISEFYQYTDRRGVERIRCECKTCNLQTRKMNRMRGDK